ncbi:MAG: hypothetical protein K0S07_261 [Chlamydiales bacterium]|jgi:tetratricopeptide (TPR) repeat protein|nr:hypothetical protein [Chlamydiales bacterium]
MTSFSAPSQNFTTIDKQTFNEQIGLLLPPLHQQLRSLLQYYVLFNLLFLFIALGEFTFFLVCFSDLAHSSILAVSLGVAFLTIFSYFILRLYLLAKKPEQLLLLSENTIEQCKKILNYQEGVLEHHFALANAAYRIASSLHGKEYDYYTPFAPIEAIKPSLERFSCFWHWLDLHRMKELFLTRSVEEHIKLVKSEPTSLELHAALANAYVTLSSIYVDPRKSEGQDEDRWIPDDAILNELSQKFRFTAERAIEEFKILNDYAPDDPWIHSQLAYSYHDLQMPEEEIREYETILTLRPDDKETLFKLGTLYFQQGLNAKGLRIYEKLKRSNYKQAELLIKFYGGYTPAPEPVAF